ncbi:hypothetical protein KUTeg_020029 [Tegillarca granosa]|uniref:Uncharacterized protein n=1 Tax=Tegillarca granosa TaxID=220873 RepID=A0ABQ9EEA3_TEGGR|nr:hypothetical protein KUTeg_020029 [Tegillarca granosa]
MLMFIRLTQIIIDIIYPQVRTEGQDQSLMSSSGHGRNNIQNDEGILKAAMLASGMDIPTTNNSLSNLSKPSSNYETGSHIGLTSQASGLSNTTSSISVDIHESFSGLTSEMFSPNAANVIDPNIVMNSHNPEDFFSSLALQSKSSMKEQQISAHNAVQSILNQVNFDKETGTNVNDNIANDLPISNILNNLNFNSDDEDMNFTFSDDDFFGEAFSDDSDEDAHPPRHHTSGKWKPGQGPPQQHEGKWKPGQGPKHHFTGKWKPGQGPGSVGGKWKSSLSHNKVKLKLSAVSKKTSNSYQKDGYFCKYCNIYLKNRFAYSSHCASQKHKENVLNGSCHVPSEDTQVLETEVSKNTDMTGKSIKCRSCNVTLRNRFAYSSHCRSKQHRNNVERGDNYIRYQDNADMGEDRLNDTGGQRETTVEKNESEESKGISDNCQDDEGKDIQDQEKKEISKQVNDDNSTLSENGQNECQVTEKESEENCTSEIQHKDLASKEDKKEEELAEEECLKQHNDLELEADSKSKDTDTAEIQNVNHFDSDTENEDINLGQVNNDENLSQQDNGESKEEEQEMDNKNVTPEENTENITDDKDDNDDCSQEKDKELIDNGTAEVDKKPSSLLLCCICDQKFYSKYVLARHFLSKYHRNRAKNHINAISILEDYHKYIVRLSPFQCLVCRFYFNQEEELVKHLSSDDHIQQCEDSSAPLFCTACKYVSHLNTEIIEHLKTYKPHLDAMKKRNKPCIIKERHYQAMCKYCNKILHSHVHMKHHVKTKHGKDIYLNECMQKNVCTMCGENFKSQNAIKLHIQKRHLTAGQVYCHVCNKIVMGKMAYKRHIEGERHKLLLGKYRSVQNMTSLRRTAGFVNRLSLNRREKNLIVKSEKFSKRNQVEDRVYKCEYCDFVANKYADLRPHYIEKHSKHVLVCDVCDLTFISEKARKLHYASKQHQGNLEKAEGVTKVIKCPLCPKKFSDEGLKNFHVEVYHAHPSNEDQLQLKLGGPCYTSQLYKDYFRSISHIDKSEKVTCPDKSCGKELKKENMLEHLRLHSGDKPFKCRYCSNGFISTSTLRRHIIGHLGLQQRKCEICGKEYKKLASYREHMQQHELEKNQAQKLMCDVCGQSFYLKRQLQSHMRRHGERKFKCTVEGCHWTFYFATELNFHMRSHTREKPYLCDLCGYAAATKNRLLRHSRTHSGERLHHCEYCTYKAGTSTHLRRHMRIHIGCKPYKCPYCSYTCNTHENVRKHIMKTKKHSGLFIYPCKFCSYATNAVSEFKSHLMFQHAGQVEITSNDSMAQYTGLYQPQEDPRKPTEGMKINPVKERRQHFGKPKSKQLIKKQEEVLQENESDPEDRNQNEGHVYSRNSEEGSHLPRSEDGKNNTWVPPPVHYNIPPPMIPNVYSLAHGSYQHYGMGRPPLNLNPGHYYDRHKDLSHHRGSSSLVSMEDYPKLVIDEFRDSENKKSSHFDVNLVEAHMNMENHN